MTSSYAPKSRDMPTHPIHFNEDDEYDISLNPEEYLKTLYTQQQSAKILGIQDKQRRDKILECLPLTEKLKMIKEAKVLSIWEERQQEWERIQNNLQNKIYGGQMHGKDLLMESIDVCRPKIEEYDMIQAARPLRERFWAESWVPSLRNGVGGRIATVGNIYSGLECQTEQPIKPPAIVRKPHSSIQSKLTNNSSVLFDRSTTINLETRKKAISNEIYYIRPHQPSAKNIAQLVICATDLFQWAVDSSKEYFNRNNEENDVESDIQPEESNAEPTNADNPEPQKAEPAITYLSSNHLTFESKQGELSTQSIQFQNSGSIAIEYRWERMLKSNEDFNYSIDPPRELVICDKKSQFSCINSQGTCLPGDVITTRFVFKALDLPGIFQEEWRLSCFPSAKIITSFDSPDDTSIFLHGHNIYIDEKEYLREELNDFLVDESIRTFVGDILESCISRIRVPVTMQDIHDREKEAFLAVNKHLIEECIQKSPNKELPLFLSVERIHDIESLCSRIVNYCAVIAETYLYLKKKMDETDHGRLGDDVLIVNRNVLDEEDRKIVRDIEATNSSSQTLQTVADILFPEKQFEIFDEVSQEDVLPRWDYSIENAVATLTTCLEYARAIPSFEMELTQRVKRHKKKMIMEEKLEAKRLKEELRAQRALERDEDDDDDEQSDEDEKETEEEEEDEEEEEVNPDETNVLNDWLDKAQKYKSECYGRILHMFCPIFPKEELYSMTTAILVERLDNFESFSLQAEMKSGISTSTGPPLSANPKAPVPQNIDTTFVRYPSPFTSDEGKLLWDAALQAPMVFEKKKKGSAPAQSSKSRPHTAPIVANNEQVQVYYRNMYDTVKETLNGIIDEMFDQVNQKMVQYGANILQASSLAPSTFFEVGMYRSTDLGIDSTDANASSKISSVRGKVAMVNFAGDSFTRLKSSYNSAFDVPTTERNKSLQSLKKLGDLGAKAIVIIYESSPEAESNSFLSAAKIYFEEFFTPLNILASTNNTQLKIMYDIQYCSSMAELKYRLRQFIQHQETTNAAIPSPRSINNPKKKGKKKGIIPPIVLPIFVLEDIRLDGVIPKIPELDHPESSIDDAPLFIGEEEYEVERQKEWRKKGPHRVNCTIPTTNLNHGTKDEIVECFSSPTAAIHDLLQLGALFAPDHGCIWIDSNLKVLSPFPKDLSKFRISEVEDYEEILRRQGLVLSSKLSYLTGNRFSSQRIREFNLWLGVLTSLPTSLKYFQPISDDNDAMDSMVRQHFQSLFPRILPSDPRSVRAIAVIGGRLRHDKFVALHQLMDMIDTMYIAGELAVPFVSYSQRCRFTKYLDECHQYESLCGQLLEKARMTGKRIILPVDFSFGDEEIIQSDINANSSQSSAPCDEGLEYLGENLIRSVSDITQSTGIVDEYAYDIGKDSILMLREHLLASDLVLSWGPIGVCEYGCFQYGQRALVEIASQVAYADRSVISYLDKNKPSQTIVIGNDCNEWHSRIIDSDCDYGGDLVGAGILAYSMRESNIFSSIVGRYPSNYIQEQVVRRMPLPGPDEWVFNTPAVEDEEDDS